MLDRGKVERVGVIRDPSIAAAAAKCWLWRWTKQIHKIDREGLGPALMKLHAEEEPCNFCDYPADGLVIALEEFVGWAGLTKDSDVTSLRPELEAFIMLPPQEQRRHVLAAQYGVDDDDE